MIYLRKLGREDRYSNCHIKRIRKALPGCVPVSYTHLAGCDAVRPPDAFRRLRFQQIAQRGVCARRVSDGVSQGTLDVYKRQLMDIEMPGMNGMDTLRYMKRCV